jgi:hypothetical protein
VSDSVYRWAICLILLGGFGLIYYKLDQDLPGEYTIGDVPIELERLSRDTRNENTLKAIAADLDSIESRLRVWGVKIEN